MASENLEYILWVNCNTKIWFFTHSNIFIYNIYLFYAHHPNEPFWNGSLCQSFENASATISVQLRLLPKLWKAHIISASET